MLTTSENATNRRKHRPVSDDAASRNRPRPVRTFSIDEEENDTRPFLQRYKLVIAVLAVAGVIAGSLVKLVTGASASAPKVSSTVFVTLPPPPPPPPPQTAPPEQKLMDQQTFQPEEKPQDEPPKPPDQPPIGTNIKGDGTANSFGLGNAAGKGSGEGSNGTRFGWYAGQVQTTIGDALRNNRKTRSAEISLRARIWPDATGRVTHAQLTGSTGDLGLDATIRDEVLTGLQLREPPPAGMPLPIVLRLTAKRPR